jgi:nitroreductase
MKYNVSEIIEVIQNRRTIKPEDFSDRKVHKEIIETLLDSARWAPTHGLTQPWQFKVFMTNGINQFADFHAEAYKSSVSETDFNPRKYTKLKNRPLLASAIIAIGVKRQETQKIPEIEEIAAVSCAVQNIQLVATAYGLATYWGSGGMTYSEEMKSFLGLRKNDKCLGFLYVGYPNIEWPKGQRRPIEYFTEWVD